MDCTTAVAFIDPILSFKWASHKCMMEMEKRNGTIHMAISPSMKVSKHYGVWLQLWLLIQLLIQRMLVVECRTHAARVPLHTLNVKIEQADIAMAAALTRLVTPRTVEIPISSSICKPMRISILDTVWGGYCVFAEVVVEDTTGSSNGISISNSMSVVDRIAAHIKNTRENVEIVKATLLD
jgi:hypothetical protein